MRRSPRPVRAALLTLATALGTLVPATGASSPAAAGSPDEFVIASFNVLGASHTDGRHDRGFDRSGVRLRRAIKVLDRTGADVVGLQEFQLPQRNRFVARVGDQWGLHSGYSHNTDNTIAWRTDRFSYVDGWTRRVPYFHGRMRKMPIVALRSRASGQTIYVMNVHNPADSKGNAERWRRKAMRIERKVTSRLTQQLHAPVFLTGDMNDREDFFCPFTGNGVMHSFLGGSNPPGTSCAPPRSGIDWVFGNQYVEFSSPQIDRSWLVARTSDHPIVSAHVVLR